MKSFVVIFALVLVVVYADDKYTTKYDSVDIDSILKNDRLTNKYLDCLLDKGNCTPDAQELKGILGDALETECSKCNDRQKDASRKVIRHLLKNKRDKWNELQAKYDPNNIYIAKYKTELKNEGIVL